MVRTWTLSVGAWLLCLPGSLPVIAADDDRAFVKEMADLQAMCKGLDTEADKVESFGRQLLEKYRRPDQQARIHYELADVHANSGLVHTELIVDHTRQALQLPLEPVLRVRLYVHWGNAVKVSNRDKPVVLNRKAAAAIYLQGLKELEKYNLPETSPKVPQWPRGSPRAQLKPAEEAERMFAERMAARRKAESEWKMCQYRDGFHRQLASLYSLTPYAGTEIRELAAEILGSSPTVDAVLKPLEAQGLLIDDPGPEDAAGRPLEPRGGSLGWTLAGLALLVAVGIGLFLLSARRRRSRQPDAAAATGGEARVGRQ